MTTANEIWGPERLKRINSDPALVSLLYDLNLLPEVVLAHIRAARVEEREHCIRLIEAPIPGLRALAAAGMSGSGIAQTHIEALTEAAKCVRESGEFADALREKKDQAAGGR